MIGKIVSTLLLLNVLLILPQSVMAQSKLYRYWSQGCGDHFYTTNKNEIQRGSHYHLEGIQCMVFDSQQPGTVPLYRYYNSNNCDHFYTINWNELKEGADGYKYEAPAGYVYSNQVTGTIPWYRYWCSAIGDHFYTTDPNNEKLEGYSAEGIACYVLPYNGTPESDTPRFLALGFEPGFPFDLKLNVINCYKEYRDSVCWRFGEEVRDGRKWSFKGYLTWSNEDAEQWIRENIPPRWSREIIERDH